MNKYESVCILAPDCSYEQILNIIEKIQNKISEFTSKPINIEFVGKKKLAYEVNKYKEGIYYIIKFQSKSEYISELERFYKITEEILKFIIVRED